MFKWILERFIFPSEDKLLIAKDFWRDLTVDTYQNDKSISGMFIDDDVAVLD